ncbi:MAG TPA: hypothetical protein VF507_06210 [Pyrinomonadaceae bacterium]
MEDLVKQVSQRAGISEDKAREAVNTVLGFLKERLPGPIAGQVDNVMNTAGGTIANAGGALADQAGNLIGGLGGMLGGGKKD